MTKTTSLSDLLPDEWKGVMLPEFEPVCSYFPLIDSIIYLEEDVSYRSKYIDGCIYHLLHPYEDRIVGVKLECASKVCEMMRDEVHAKAGNMLSKDVPDSFRKVFNEEMNKNRYIEINLSSLFHHVFLRAHRFDHHEAYSAVTAFLKDKGVRVNPYEIIDEAAKLVSFS